MSAPVVGVSGQDSAGAIKLFQQHDAHQLVRPGGLAEGKLELGALVQARRQPVGAADQKAHRRTVLGAPFAQLRGERRAVEVLALFVQDDDG